MRTYSTRKRILVTGGAGFLGSHHLFGWSRPAVSHLCERLLAEGNDVLCADNFFTGTKDNIAHHLFGWFRPSVSYLLSTPRPKTTGAT